MKLKGEYLITAGLLVMVAGVLTGLTLNDRDDDLWWKDRYYTVLEKHSPSLQEHGRRVYVEHYITLRYEDDGSSYVKEVSPAKFFAVKEGGNFPTGEGNTLLLNDEGFMCCLGFRCHQMGIPKKDLLDVCAPGGLSSRYGIPDLIEEKSWGWVNSSFSENAVEINDDTFLTPRTTRESYNRTF